MTNYETNFSYDSELRMNFDSLRGLQQTCRTILAASKIHFSLVSIDSTGTCDGNMKGCIYK